MLSTIHRLMTADQDKPVRIAVIGDAIEDHYLQGQLTTCQDGCPCWNTATEVVVPGGAANAARSLSRWNAEAWLISPLHRPLEAAWRDVNMELCFKSCFNTVPRKYRFLDEQNRIVWRQDEEDHHQCYGMKTEEMKEAQELAVKAIREMGFKAVLICDYQKGFLTAELAREIIDICREKEVPVVADAKLPPDYFSGAVLKCNNAYAFKNYSPVSGHSPCAVVTHGAHSPCLTGEQFGMLTLDDSQCYAVLRNHVGAGDCFGAHLALGLAHGLEMTQAALFAHSAGRVYVQHLHNRPPWPHEIKRDLDPVRGKAISLCHLNALRKSNSGRIVFTNGVFRFGCHAGHTQMLRWARQQGECLVVGINDDQSAAEQRPGKTVLPLVERMECLAALECVDWVVPYAEATPEVTITALAPDVLVKGSEYAGITVPGDQLVKETTFAPLGDFPKRHWSAPM